MQLNLKDPDSIVAWWKVYPDQHDAFLDYKVKAGPEFAPAILEARRRIDADPSLRCLRSRSPRASWGGEGGEGAAADNIQHDDLVAA